jgi:hypothetical protein
VEARFYSGSSPVTQDPPKTTDPSSIRALSSGVDSTNP